MPLVLVGERIVAISAAGVRCSVATESGRVATWLDETLADVATKLEQPAQSFPEVCRNQLIVCLFNTMFSGNTGDLGSMVVRMDGCHSREVQHFCSENILNWSSLCL